MSPTCRPSHPALLPLAALVCLAALLEALGLLGQHRQVVGPDGLMLSVGIFCVVLFQPFAVWSAVRGDLGTREAPRWRRIVLLLLLQSTASASLFVLLWEAPMWGVPTAAWEPAVYPLAGHPVSPSLKDRWQRQVNAAAAHAWRFSVPPAADVVEDAAHPDRMEAWSLRWGSTGVVGASPALLRLPDDLLVAIAAHEIGHIASASPRSKGPSLRTHTPPLALLVLAPLLLGGLIAIGWRLQSSSRAFLGALVACLGAMALTSWVGLGTLAQWAREDRRSELVADALAASWLSPADMARALVAVHGVCNGDGPSLRMGPVPWYAVHPALDTRLAALGLTADAACHSLLQPRPQSGSGLSGVIPGREDVPHEFEHTE